MNPTMPLLLANISSALSGVITRVEYSQTNVHGDVILKLWPVSMTARSSSIKTKMKHLLPLGWTLNAIIPPVPRTDIPLIKGCKVYRHPYFSVELTPAKEPL